jgi:hypothetical protein
MTGFDLDKWYFDCVGPDGAALIGYAARVRWAPFSSAYGAVLERAEDGSVEQRQCGSFGRVDQTTDGVTWSSDPLACSGTWTGGHLVGPVELFSGEEGAIEWCCLSANADTTLCRAGRTIRGTGYAERIRMTVPPWRLPFSELRWGRYISRDGLDSLVWIDWRGGCARTWTWANGVVLSDAVVDDRGVRAQGARLQFGSSRTIRQGDVASGLLGPVSLLAGALPRGVRRIDEHKRITECTFAYGDASSEGYSIDEVVVWG